jgi:hypothetical protein
MQQITEQVTYTADFTVQALKDSVSCVYLKSTNGKFSDAYVRKAGIVAIDILPNSVFCLQLADGSKWYVDNIAGLTI